MPTLLSRFCEEFVDIITPLRVPLRRANAAVGRAGGDDASSKKLKPQLQDLQHQIDQLSAKVGEQQAYVLIFGPLKSGKSTLMNSISGTYVSEVSSLPAYPCMVFVSDAPKREYAITTYAGATQTFFDPDELETHVETAHQTLASQLRSAESAGTAFDPSVHFAEAIRRIDVRLPASTLASSKAVLVDTPGLYSRMKFGYDRMTRDFRNAAACAVFVVRSDNLFLEQVFAEFNQLLELFSRIFLVVNLDSTKLDLAPTGDLVPSLEQSDPQRIVKAFENLAMSAKLKSASDKGRLRIYPVDLLRAASARIKGDAKTGKQDPTGFDRFYTDLTEYLGSSDYLRAFLGDSITRATNLLEETRDLCNRAEVVHFSKRLAALDAERAERVKRREALAKLRDHDFGPEFQALHEKLKPAVSKLAQDVGTRIQSEIREAVGTWFKTDDSLDTLAKGKLVPAYVQYQEELTSAVSRELSEAVLQGNAGIQPNKDIQAALETANIDLSAIGRAAHGRSDRAALIAVPPTPIRVEHLPVRKRLLDKLLLRRGNRVSGSVFGPSEKPALRVAATIKTARLGSDGRSAIRQRLDDYSTPFFKETIDRLRGGFLANFSGEAVRELQSSVRDALSQLDQQDRQAGTQIDQCRAVAEPLAQLREASANASKAMEALSNHYGQVDLFLLTQPLDSKAGARTEAGEPIPRAAPPTGQTTPTTPRTAATPRATPPGGAKPSPRPSNPKISPRSTDQRAPTAKPPSTVADSSKGTSKRPAPDRKPG